MRRALLIFFALLILLPLILLFGATVTKLLWWVCNMGAWTGLGHLPWGPAVFLALVLGGIGRIIALAHSTSSLLTKRGR